MKSALGILIAAIPIACFVGIGVHHSINTVSASEPGSTSEFFRTYDPGPVLSRYGTERLRSFSTGASSGLHEATRTRQVTAIVNLPEDRVANLAAALRDDVDARLRRQGHVRGRSEGSGEAAYEYDSGKAWGFFVLERIEPETPRGSAAAGTWRVRMLFIERWRS
jgi:hypothetical protein